MEWNNEDYWQIDFIAHCQGQRISKTYSSSVLGLLAARVITESLNGQFVVTESKMNELISEKTFSVRMPASK